MVREDENTWAGTLACRRIYVKRVAEDELRHWTTDGWLTLTRWQKKLHPIETLFSEPADTQLWKTPLQGSYNVTIQYVINQCDYLC